jgi:hypothetical protein
MRILRLLIRVKKQLIASWRAISGGNKWQLLWHGSDSPNYRSETPRFNEDGPTNFLLLFLMRLSQASDPCQKQLMADAFFWVF